MYSTYKYIDYIKTNEVSRSKTGKMAWRTVGPELLTKLLKTNLFTDVLIYPSYYFLPKHATGLQYMGHSIVYAYQEWGSTKQNYEIMNPEDVGVPSSAIVLTSRSGRAALRHRLSLLGFDFEKPELDKIYTRFLLMADARKMIHDEDLKELVG